VHDVEFAANLDLVLNQALPALAELKRKGKVKYIGVTGYPLHVLKTVIERSHVPIDVIITYCRYTLNDTTLLDYLPFFKERGIGVINAAALSMGLLTNNGPPSWHPATEEIRSACQSAARYCRARGVDISKLALHFCLENENIPTTLVSTAKLSEIQPNIAAVSESLTPSEREVMHYVMKTFFEPLKVKHWEGVELKRYWVKMRALNAVQPGTTGRPRAKL